MARKAKNDHQKHDMLRVRCPGWALAATLEPRHRIRCLYAKGVAPVKFRDSQIGTDLTLAVSGDKLFGIRSGEAWKIRTR